MGGRQSSNRSTQRRRTLREAVHRVDMRSVKIHSGTPDLRSKNIKQVNSSEHKDPIPTALYKVVCACDSKAVASFLGKDVPGLDTVFVQVIPAFDSTSHYSVFSQFHEPVPKLKFKWSVLHEACRLCEEEILGCLIGAGCNVNIRAFQQMSPLHTAIILSSTPFYKCTAAVKMLLRAGADVNQLNRFQEAPIAYAIAMYAPVSLIEVLLKGGSRLNSRSWGNLYLFRIESEESPSDYECAGPYSLLTLAIHSGHFDAAKVLLCHGFNPNKYPLASIVTLVKEVSGTVDKFTLDLLDCFLAAGYQLKNTDERDINQLVNGQNFMQAVKEEEREAILNKVKVLCNCKSLEQLCHQVIRTHLRKIHNQSSVIVHIMKLPLPGLLRDFLSMMKYVQPVVESKEEELRQGERGNECSDSLYIFDRKRVTASGTYPYVQFWRTHLCCGRTEFRD